MDHVVDAAPATWSFDVPPIAVDGVTHIRRPPSWWIRLRPVAFAAVKAVVRKGLDELIERVFDALFFALPRRRRNYISLLPALRPTPRSSTP